MLGLHGGQACIRKLHGCSHLSHSLTHRNIGLLISGNHGFGVHIAASTGEICHIPALGNTQSIPECAHQVGGGIIHIAQQVGVCLPVGDHHRGLVTTVKLYQLHGAISLSSMGQCLAAVKRLCCPMGIAVVVTVSIRIVTDIVLTGDLHRTDLRGSCCPICNGILGSLYQIGIQFRFISLDSFIFRQSQIGSCVGMGSADHNMAHRNTGSLFDGIAGIGYHRIRQGYQICGDQQEGLAFAVCNGNGSCGQAIGFIIAGRHAGGRIAITSQRCACCRCNANLTKAYLHSIGNQTQLAIFINNACILIVAEHLTGRICRGIGEGSIGISAVQGNAQQTGIAQVMKRRSHIQGHIVVYQTQIFCSTSQLCALIDGDSTVIIASTGSSCQALDAAAGHAEGGIDHIQIVSGLGGSLFCLADAAAGHGEGCALQLHIVAIAAGATAVDLARCHIGVHAGI